MSDGRDKDADLADWLDALRLAEMRKALSAKADVENELEMRRRRASAEAAFAQRLAEEKRNGDKQ